MESQCLGGESIFKRRSRMCQAQKLIEVSYILFINQGRKLFIRETFTSYLKVKFGRIFLSILSDQYILNILLLINHPIIHLRIDKKSLRRWKM
jgi:hypothetical protein